MLRGSGGIPARAGPGGGTAPTARGSSPVLLRPAAQVCETRSEIPKEVSWKVLEGSRAEQEPSLPAAGRAALRPSLLSSPAAGQPLGYRGTTDGTTQPEGKASELCLAQSCKY